MMMKMETSDTRLLNIHTDVFIFVVIFQTVFHPTSATCPAPPQAIGSRQNATSQGSYRTNAVIVYTCKSGFYLKEPSPLRVCLDNGSWTGVDAPCKINTASLGYAVMCSVVAIVIFVVLMAWALNRHHYHRSGKQKLKRRIPFEFTRTDPGFQYKQQFTESTSDSRRSSLLELPLSTWDAQCNSAIGAGDVHPRDRSELGSVHPTDPSHLYARPASARGQVNGHAKIQERTQRNVVVENGTVQSGIHAGSPRIGQTGASTVISISEIYPIDVTSL